LGAAFPSVQASEVNLEAHIPLTTHTAGAKIQHGFADAVYGELIFGNYQAGGILRLCSGCLPPRKHSEHSRRGLRLGSYETFGDRARINWQEASK
jgi:hypothetical protein